MLSDITGKLYTAAIVYGEIEKYDIKIQKIIRVTGKQIAAFCGKTKLTYTVYDRKASFAKDCSGFYDICQSISV